MQTIRTAIIGVGNMGTAHARRIWEGHVKGMHLHAVCDIDPARLAICEDQFPGVACFANAEELVQSGTADAVIIATPHPFHGKIGVLCLEHGLHTLVEKPIDIRLTQAQLLCDAAQKSGKVFALMLNQRTNPLLRKAREIVQQGLLGDLKRSVWIITNWYRTQVYYDSGAWRATWRGEGGGVLMNQAPHNLDLWQWICGMPVQVTGFCDTAHDHHIEVEDNATILAKFANGADGVFITSTGEYPGTNRLQISGTLGKLVLEGGVMKWWKLKTPEDEVRFHSDQGFAKIPYDYEEITIDEPETGHTGILQSFSDAIRLGTPLISPGQDGLRQLQICNAAYLSQWLGSVPVKLPIDRATYDQKLKEHQDVSVYHEGHREELQINGQYSERWKVRW